MAVPTRKLCTSPFHEGSRWLLAYSFDAQQWLPNKAAPTYLQSQCRTCQRRRNRTEAVRRSKRIHEREKDRKRREEKRVVLPAAPFASYLLSRVKVHQEQLGYEQMFSGGAGKDGPVVRASMEVGLEPEQVSKLINGYTKTVELDIVDRVLTRSDVSLYDLYPHLAD